MSAPVPESTRTISYLGTEYTVPEWVRFIATNSNGRVTGFEGKPHANAHGGIWVTSMEHRRHVLARDSPEVYVEDWDKSCVTLAGAPRPTPEQPPHDIRATIDQVNKRRAQLESAIRDLVAEFQRETGVLVKAVGIDHEYVELESGANEYVATTVSARLQWNER